MRLIDIEEELKQLIDSNPSDTDLYNKLYEFVYRFLKYKKVMNNEFEYEEVASIGAEDLFLKISNGGKVSSWLGYINISHLGYVRKKKKKYFSEVIETEGNPKLAEGITLMSAASLLQNPFDFLKTENLEYIENNIETTINWVLDDSMFLRYTEEYYNAKLSIILSILLGKFVLFGDKKNKNYVHILYVLAKDAIINTIGFGSNNLSESLRQYALDYCCVEDEYRE